MKRHIACMVLGGVLTVYAPALAAEYTRLDIAASPAGGAWYVGLGAYAKVLSDMYPELEVSLFPGGANANVLRVAKGASQIGATMLPNMKAAVDGLDPYKTPIKDIAALANIQDITRLHFVAPADSPVTSLREIAEKRIPVRLGTGVVGGNAELFARWVLAEYGITRESIREWGGSVYHLKTSEAQAMLAENQLDMHTWMGPGESFIYSELVKTKPVRILDVDDDILARVAEKYGLASGTIPAGFYGGVMGRDVKTVVSSAGLMVNRNIPDDMAYMLARALDRGAKDIAVALPSWGGMTSGNICKGLPIELHPGAARYYRESGCLE